MNIFYIVLPQGDLRPITSAHERCIKCVLTIDCQVYTCQNCLTHQEIIDDVLILMMLKQKLPFLGLPFFEKCNSYQEHPLPSLRVRKVFFAFYALLIIQLFSCWVKTLFYQCMTATCRVSYPMFNKTVHYFSMCDNL